MAAGLGAWQAGIVPSPARAWAWLCDHRDLGPRFAAETGIALLAWQGGLAAIAAVAGLAVLGTVNAARVILGPFNLLALGVVGFAIPEGAAIWRRRPERLPRAIRTLGVGLASMALLCTAILLLMPDRLGIELLGKTWPGARNILPLVGLWVAAEAAGQGARIGLMVLGNSRAVLLARAVTAPLILVAGPIGAVWGGAGGAAIGLALAHCLGTCFWWRKFALGYGGALTARSVASEPHSAPDRPPVEHVEPWLAAVEGDISK